MTVAQKIEAAEAASHALPALPRHAQPSHAQPGPGSPCPESSYTKKLARLLDRTGGVYLVDDILSLIAEGKMQSFCLNNSWIITQIQIYPRAKVLEVFAAIGDLDDLRILHDRIIDFAAEIGAGVIRANGRRGWLSDAMQRGWRVKARNFIFQKDC